ncbi:MAG: hypothetical protein LQ352_000823 [Teloschistes flavicans]|nr:MAG: hypothetical protein LQ352_000823 [Teloschistes flavicans]
MPWNRLRGGQFDSLRRHSTLNLDQPDKHDQTDYGTERKAEEPASLHPDGTFNSVSNLTIHDHELHTSLSHGQSPSPYTQEPQVRPQRFSLLKFRHASDPQLARTARNQAMLDRPPMPAAPSIITTAPTTEATDTVHKRRSALLFPRRQKLPDAPPSLSSKPSKLSLKETSMRAGNDGAGSNSHNQSARASRITFDEPEKQRASMSPPAYGDDANSTLALPVSRLSESSRSDGSFGDHGVYATTTTTHTVSTTTTFFRLPRRKKNKGPLFPLPVKIPPQVPSPEKSLISRPSDSQRTSESPQRYTPVQRSPLTAMRRPFFSSGSYSGRSSPLPSPSRVAPALSFAAPGIPNLRRDSTQSTRSGRSSSILAASKLSKRGRSSTNGSLHGYVDDEPLPTPSLPQSTRTSSSTGRTSLGGIFNLSRLRQSSEPQHPRHGSSQVGMPGTPISGGSKSQSLSLSRDLLVVPPRQEGDTPAKYLLRLEEAVSRGAVAAVLSKSDDDFSKNVLRSYMRGFKFFGDPLDMSIRKLLMEAELPKETQQIDRVLQAFANRYHECNPGIYASPDEAYFIAFSILILHTDVFNKNNKHKMQKLDYTKNARGTGVADEVLECFYDNISYTPFIHVEDDLDINGERIISHKAKKGTLSKGSGDVIRRKSNEPVDPYSLILDNRLDSLRPSLKDVMFLDDPYSYIGTAQALNLADLHKTFFRTGVLQILSSRSRPEAFMSPETTNNPAEAHPGVVDIKITKVGMLWRKDMKKKKARSPWQEWGAILTGSQLYFFRNTGWVRSLMHQCSSHHKHGLAGSPCVFKPPLEQFKPDVLMSTENAVALLDSTYKKHKHALVFVRHGGFEETFLAENENEMNDWLAKLNYASAFRSAGVRMRGLVGGHYDGQRTRAMRRMDTDSTTVSVQSPTGEVTVAKGRIDPLLAQQIQEARKQIMMHKIEEAEEKLDSSRRQLDIHLRNARHLQILAPIQNRTREQLILAAGGMAAKIKWVRMEMWRVRCHKDILALDLEEEVGKSELQRYRNDVAPRPTLPDLTPSPYSAGRKGSAVDYVGTPQTRPLSDSTIRPSTQPSAAKPSTSEDVFQDTLAAATEQRRQASWELPPLSFEPSRRSSKSMPSAAGAEGSRVVTPPRHELRHEPSVASNRTSEVTPDLAARLATPTTSVDDEEQEVLKEAGLLRSETPTPTSTRQDTAAGGETAPDSSQSKPRISDPGFGDGRPKVRRSLQRTLREAHVPSHHRGRKGKDSASSVGMSDESASVPEKEGLSRGAGSFTVHGKKASVITFGSEWQSLSPEERLNFRKQAQGDESKMDAVEDEGSSQRLRVEGGGSRPTSTRSVSTEASFQRPESAPRTLSSSRASTQ